MLGSFDPRRPQDLPPALPGIADSLQRSLELERKPVAVCLTDEPPPDVPAFEGRVTAGCRFWEEAARGPFSTVVGDHEMCAIGVYTHNLAGPSSSHERELADVLRVMSGLEYVRDEDVARIPVIREARRHVLYAPLAESPLPPDVVLLFVDSARGLVVTEAVQQLEPESPPVMGRPACAVVPQVLNTGRAALSLGCCGARAYLDALSPGVALWALPGARLAEYAARIEKLAEANRTLTRFHDLRRQDVQRGRTPTVQESLARLQP